MTQHVYSDVAIAAVFNTRQARVLEGYDSLRIATEAARGVLAEAGIDATEVDGVFGQFSSELIYSLGLGSVWAGAAMGGGIQVILEAANAIATGNCHTALVTGGGAGDLHRAGLHGPVDPAVQRVRRVLRHVHRPGVRPHRPAPHGDVRHQTGAAGHGRGHDPQQRPRQSRGRLLRQGAVHR